MELQKRISKKLLYAPLLTLLPQLLTADIRLPSIISDHMILQADKSAAIWGWAEPGEKITVKFSEQEQTTIADQNGDWLVILAPMPASHTPRILQISSFKSQVSVSDVLIGEVWLCSGQSNMQWELQQAQRAASEIPAADFPRMRIFNAGRRPHISPQKNITGKWEIVTPDTVRKFTAVGYYFGKSLHQRLNKPVGLISSCRGGTPAQAWTPRNVLESNPELLIYSKQLAEIEQKYPTIHQDWDRLIDQSNTEFNQWKKASREWKKLPKDQRNLNGQPRWPEISVLRKVPSGYYNSNIAPLTNYALRGVIWYQGEANSNSLEEGQLYGTLFPAMITSWRRAWGEELPFYFVELPNYTGKPGMWPTLRESQLLTWKNTPRTGMAVTIDIGDPNDIHPTNKLPVGERLARIARANVYGEDIEWSGPIFRKSTVEGSKLRFHFDHIGGLTAKGNTLAGFEISADGQNYVPAEAKIDGTTILVWNDQISAPIVARYAWTDNPDASLFNLEGLPASPFQTKKGADE